MNVQQQRDALLTMLDKILGMEWSPTKTTPANHWREAVSLSDEIKAFKRVE